MSRLSPLRRAWRILCSAAFVVAVVVWVVALRPQVLGGPAGYVTVNGTSMEPTMRTGDVVLVHRQASYRTGEVVAYRIPAGQAGAGRVVIHRVTGGSAADGYVVRGDNRDTDDLWRPRPADVLGAERLRAPALGLLARMVVSPIGLGLMAALAVMVIIATAPAKRVQRRPRTPPARNAPPGAVVVDSQPPPRAIDAVPARTATGRRRYSSVVFSPRWRARCDFTNAEAIAAVARARSAGAGLGARMIDRDRAPDAARPRRSRARRQP